MRVLICGGRDYDDYKTVCEVLDPLKNDIDFVIQGGARGADSLARKWAESRCVPLITYFANWDKYGRAAGPMRNQYMIDDGCPDLVVAFPGGRGTKDMIKRAKDEPITVMEVT